MGSQTRYVFQYLTDAAYRENGEGFTGAVEAPVGGAVIGSGQGALSAAVGVAGLIPDTAYRFRVVATSRCSSKEPERVCEGVGGVQGFSTFPVEGAALPDGRGYELVSPVDKYGGEILPSEPNTTSCAPVECKPGVTYQHFPMQSAPDGEAVVYESSPVSLQGGGVIENELLSRRSASGWQTANLTPPLLYTKGGGGYEAFDAGLTHGVIESLYAALSPDAPSEYSDLYVQPTGDPLSLSPLISDAPLNHTSFNRSPGNNSNSLNITYDGASADMTRIFFTANDALSAEASGGPEGKSNLYEWAGGQLRSVNLAPGSSETTPGARFGGKGVVAHAISNDGTRVFWSSESGQVYVRENGERTVEISDHTAGFLTASVDGSKLLLTDGHLFGIGDDDEEPVVDLTQGKGGFQGVVGQSEDLSHVYFVDTEVLSEEANERGGKAQAGKDNLYAWSEGTTVFIATLLAADSGIGSSEVAHVAKDWDASPATRTAEASPRGRRLAFLSRASLTGYDNTGLCGRISGTSEFFEAPCNEAYIYDSGTGKLRCASCDLSGAAPIGPTAFALIKGAGGALPQPRYLTDSGRLFFDSQDSLVPADTNHGVEDVYEFEPEGVGTCTRDSGCVSLISAGTGKADSNFLTMDTSGKNVFFTTRDQLVPADRDEAIDLYDAREGGGIARESEPESNGCHGEACQPSVGAPGEPSPASSIFSSAGNLTLTGPFGVTVKPKTKVLTRAQVLARALRACKGKPKKKRAVCKRTARRKYAVKASVKRTVGNRKGGK